MKKTTISPTDSKKIRVLESIINELSDGQCFSITRLTRIKSLCKNPTVAAQFAVYLAQKTYQKSLSKSIPINLEKAEWETHNELVKTVVTFLEGYIKRPSEQKNKKLWNFLNQLESINNKYQKIGWNDVRIVRNYGVLIVEEALYCLLRPKEASFWAYQVTSDYVRHHNSYSGTDLGSDSVTSLKEIVDFWHNFYGITR